MVKIDKNALKKKKNKLGTPPKMSDTKNNLESPEVAPAPEKKTVAKKPSKTTKKKEMGRPKTDKTEKLTTTLRPDFKKDLKILSITLDMHIGDIIEQAVRQWEKTK